MTKPRRRQAGEGGVYAYQTKAGVRWMIKYEGWRPDGTFGTVVKRGFLTRKAALDELGDRLAAIRKGVQAAASSNKTVRQLARVYLDGLRLAPSTKASYEQNFRLHILPEIGDVKLTQLSGARISALYRKLEKTGRRDHAAGTGLSARTIRYCHVILKAMLQQAISDGLLVANPCDRAKPPSAKEARPPELRPWNAGELSTFLAWADGHDCSDAAAWRVLAFTGMRRGEALALRWRDLDIDGARVSVRRSVGLVRTKGQGAELIEGTTKSGRERVVDLDPQSVDALRRWRVARAGLSLDLARDGALVFGTLEGQHQNPVRFSQRFTEALARCARDLGDAAPPVIRLHDLRHCHATILLGAGVPIKIISERLGHSSVVITMHVYAHVMPGMQAEAAAKFAALVGGNP
jgi:integrase